MNAQKKTAILVILILLVGVLSVIIAFARNSATSSENFQLLAQAFPALSGASTSENHTLFQSGGELGGGQQSTSESFALHSGFWLGDSITPTPTSTETPTPTLTPTPPPPSGPVFLPIIVRPVPFFEPPNEEEDNDSASQANGPLRFGPAYSPYPDDTWDFFYVILTSTGQITIDVTDHPLAGDNGLQVQLYYQSVSANNKVGVANVAPYHIEYSGQPGTYYIVVFTDVSKCGPCETPYQVEVDSP